ncbi:MAG TPA: DUF1353 domain-containing protein [Burkholderiales bacterium]|nr:DUF1353 domain-containing protein [Burkholderiales bacterium]
MLAIAAACLCSAAISADTARFSGRLAVELVDEIEFDHKFRLLEDFSFVDAAGKVWLARRGDIVDDESVPRELGSLSALLPHVSEYRKAAIVHRHFVLVRTEPWRRVDRMLYDASLAEGVSEPQAKMLYAAVYAGGWRWEPRESSCYGSCHASAVSLAWKPAATPSEILPVLEWIAHAGPTLDQVDQRMDAAIRKPGPHLFAQGH